MELTTANSRESAENRLGDSPTILRGVAQALAALPEMDELRRRVGQQDDLSTDLLLILSRHNAEQRRPVIVLLHGEGVLRAAVIFAERCILGFGIGLLRGGDQAGDGAVIAAEHERKMALLRAMDVLLEHHCCHTVAASLRGAAHETVGAKKERVRTEFCSRTVRRYLPLRATFQETLQERFTLKKRRNLLYYRRSLLKDFDVEFVPQLAIDDARLALRQLALNSWPHRTPREIELHCEFLSRHAECFCMGIRMETGIWLSLVTGWRIDGVTYMPWQLNHAAYQDASLMQVMRTYLMEHECSAGQKALGWVGGTVAFQTACEPEFCLDILKTQRGVRSALLQYLVAPLLAKRNPSAFTGGSLMLLLSPRRRGSLSHRSDPDS